MWGIKNINYFQINNNDTQNPLPSTLDKGDITSVNTDKLDQSAA